MSEDIKSGEEKRKEALESIDYWLTQRNLSLFRIFELKKGISLLESEILQEKNKCLDFKINIRREINSNIKFLTPSDVSQFGIKPSGSEDADKQGGEIE